MSPDSTRAPFTDAEQAYYNQLYEDVTAGRIPAVGRGTRRDGSRISDTDLDAILRGRPGLGQSHATAVTAAVTRPVRTQGEIIRDEPAAAAARIVDYLVAEKLISDQK